MTLLDSEQVISELFDVDGSARDINFLAVQPSCAAHFVESLLLCSELTNVFSENLSHEDAIPLPAQVERLAQSGSGYLEMLFASTHFCFDQYQCFIDWSDGMCDVEVNIFPQDFDQKRFELNGFVNMLDAWAELLSVDNYYVRYESYAWAAGDSGGNSVIFTKQNKPRELKQ